MKKKLIIIILSSVIISTVVLAQAVNKIFPDVSEKDWFYEAINYLTEKQFIEGYQDSTFKPHQNITRAETAQILYKQIQYLEPKITALENVVFEAPREEYINKNNIYKISYNSLIWKNITEEDYTESEIFDYQYRLSGCSKTVTNEEAKMVYCDVGEPMGFSIDLFQENQPSIESYQSVEINSDWKSETWKYNYYEFCTEEEIANNKIKCSTMPYYANEYFLTNENGWLIKITFHSLLKSNLETFETEQTKILENFSWL